MKTPSILLAALLFSTQAFAGLITNTYELTINNLEGLYASGNSVAIGDKMTFDITYDDEGTFYSLYLDGDNGLSDNGMGDDVLYHQRNLTDFSSFSMFSDALIDLSNIQLTAAKLETELGLIENDNFAENSSFATKVDQVGFYSLDFAVFADSTLFNMFTSSEGQGFYFDKFYTNGYGGLYGDDLTLLSSKAASVSEPSALALLALSVVSLLRLRRAR